jgi:hypothetical protein
MGVKKDGGQKERIVWFLEGSSAMDYKQRAFFQYCSRESQALWTWWWKTHHFKLLAALFESKINDWDLCHISFKDWKNLYQSSPKKMQP